MSEENVDRMRAGIGAMNRPDIETFFNLVEHFDSWRNYCDDTRDLGDRDAPLALG